MKDPKYILITGASSGIGAALAEYYSQSGVTLYLSGRNEERLREITKTCQTLGAKVHERVLDVQDQDMMADWILNIPKLDLAIANAGISGGTGGRLDGEPLSEARQIMNVNIYGVLNTIEPSLELMRKQSKGGQIAIISSLAGFRGWPSSPAYSASKGAVRFYGEALRGSLRQTNIKVNVVCPGFVTSRITDQNDFPMPFKMEANKAVKIIANNLAKNKGRICFPWPMHFMSWFIGILPDALAQKLLAKAPAKSASLD
jgi:short-subunit dehydrogenase